MALEGQGQDELFAMLAGSQRARPAARIEVDGQDVQFRHPADAIDAGVVYVPGDRAEALLMQRSVRENIALPFSARPPAWGPSTWRAEKARVDARIARLQIDTRAQGEVQRLSGGNQQKVTIARWIAAGSRIMLCFDPTRGIDIRTKRQIYPLLRELAAQGVSVLLYTSELEEVRLVCDRAIVIFGGRVVDDLPAERADEPSLMRAAHGLPREGGAARMTRERCRRTGHARRNGWVLGLCVLFGAPSCRHKDNSARLRRRRASDRWPGRPCPSRSRSRRRPSW